MRKLGIDAPTGIVTFMFTDIVDSTKLRDRLVATHGDVEGNEQYRQKILDPHNERIRGFLAKYEGFEVKTNGDSFVVAFEQPENAVVCAAAIQRNLHAKPIATEQGPLAVRIGIHTGNAAYVERDGRPDYDGHAVNIAARVESLLKKGERVYCSAHTASLAKNAPGIHFHSYGPYTLKGLDEPVEIVDAFWRDDLQPEPPEQPRDTLPYPWLTRWIGREREMDALEEALGTSKLVTLHGTGGVGKTRLAVETLLARGGKLPRDIVFVSLERAGDSAEGLLVAVREALGLTEVDAPDFDALLRQLRGGDRLLLLDNFETVMNAATSVPRLAATPGVRVLVTSQQALGVSGEQVVELEPMETKGTFANLESYRLFVNHAQQRAPRWQPNDDAAMRDVLVATDGLPYLIEIVASVAPKRKLRQLADELKTKLKDVHARHQSFYGRHASVQACLEWALARLPEEERTALPGLSIFAGGFDAEAAEAITETPIERLDLLVDASLLRFDQESGRYSMLPTTQQFLRELVDDKERERLAAAHAKWFIQRLDRADDALRAKGGEAQMAARRWIDTEYENVRQGVAWAQVREPKLFKRAVESFPIYLRQTCRFSENMQLQEALTGRIDRHTDPDAWASAQNNLGNSYVELLTGDRTESLAKAIACFQMALEVYTEQDTPAKWAMAQNNLGTAFRLRSDNHPEDLPKAIACYEAALRVHTEEAFPIDWALAQNNLANAYALLTSGDPVDNVMKAIRCYEAALRVRTERDFPVAWAMTQNNLGAAYTRLQTDNREVMRTAIGHFEAALRVYTERDFPDVWAFTQYNLGHAHEELSNGRPDDHRRMAILCFESAASTLDAIGITDRAQLARERAQELRDLPT